MTDSVALSEASEVLEEVQPRRFPPYPDYKDSGVPWLGPIPTHWDVQRLKNVASVRFSNVDKKSSEDEEPVLLCNYIDVYHNDYITDAIEFMQATASREEAARFALRRGDVLITKDSEAWNDIAVPAFVRHDLRGVICGYHLAQVRPRADRVDGEYLFRGFAAHGIADQFRVAANGITRYGLGRLAITGAVFPLPPLPEQRAIAAFLDRETGRIDELVAKKRRLIELLEEKRTALISHAVTKGLNPAAPMKPSGIDWLGDVPEHWDLMRLKFLSRIQGGVTLGKKYAPETTVPRPYLRVANVQDGYLDLNEITEIEIARHEVQRYELRRGDVLMTEGGDFDKLGRGYVWEGQISGCLHQNHIFAVRPDARRLDSHFLAAMLTSSHGKNYFTSTSQQTTNLATTNRTKLGNLPVPLPSVERQRVILEWIEKRATAIARVIGSTAEAIRKLTEYRSALISAAVTGKIDVRDGRHSGAGRNPEGSGA